MKKDELKQEVERVVGHELREARDFELLSQLIFKGTREQLSPTTLKRLWGYLKNEEVQTRQHTLDVLARFAGYRSYEDFCTHPDNKEDVQSGICIEERVSTEKMRLAQQPYHTIPPFLHSLSARLHLFCISGPNEVALL